MRKEITMTIHEFMEVQRGNLTVDEVVQANDMERIAGKILKNNKLRRATITTIALINMTVVAHADESAQAIAQIQKAEHSIVPILLEIIGAICTVCCIAEIGKSVMTRKGVDIGQIILKYIMAFAGASCVPWAFELIRKIFEY